MERGLYLQMYKDQFCHHFCQTYVCHFHLRRKLTSVLLIRAAMDGDIHKKNSSSLNKKAKSVDIWYKASPSVILFYNFHGRSCYFRQHNFPCKK